MKPTDHLFWSTLQKLYYIQESHGIVVTDLTFLPDTPKSKAVQGNNEVVMLSVAVDSRCQMHAVSNRSKYDVIRYVYSYMSNFKLSEMNPNVDNIHICIFTNHWDQII